MKLRTFREFQYPTLPSYDTANSDRLNSALRPLTPRRAPQRVDTLHLLNVRFEIAKDTGGWRLSWEPIAEIPLGGAPPQCRRRRLRLRGRPGRDAGAPQVDDYLAGQVVDRDARSWTN